MLLTNRDSAVSFYFECSGPQLLKLADSAPLELGYYNLQAQGLSNRRLVVDIVTE